MSRLATLALLLAALLFPIAQPLEASRTFYRVSAPARCTVERADQRAALAMLNALRAEAGLPPVEGDPALVAAARAHSEDMAENGMLSHEGSDGRSFFARVIEARFRGFPRAENVAWNQPDIPNVMRAWRESRDHLENMLLGDVSHAGIGYVCDPDKGHFWTMVLASR